MTTKIVILKYKDEEYNNRGNPDSLHGKHYGHQVETEVPEEKST